MAINVLPPKIYNRIAAGEVVERPASVVKELVENSLDAGATSVSVEIVEGGIKKIVVADNGCGLEKDDIPLAFLPHATSKISSLDDLDQIGTLGFRGEALASIASVSMVTMSTKTKSSETGFKVESKGGDISSVTEISRLNGTTLVVENLFFNTPARAKFLKKPKTEESEVVHLFEKFMLARPEVSFSLTVDGKEVYSHKGGTLDEVIYLLYGREVHDNLLEMNVNAGDVKVSGYVVSPKLSRPNRTYQTLFVNNRFVENYQISACVSGVYEPFLMKGRFPIYVLKLDLPFDRVDVNVHPNKKEVKFDDSSKIFGIVRRAVESALVGSNLIAEFEFDEKQNKKMLENEQKDPAEVDRDKQFVKYDKLSADEGASYKVTVDDAKTEEKLSSVNDYRKNGIDVINMPDFSSVKSDSVKNRPGGTIYFDHSGTSVLHEVEVAVAKKHEEEKSASKMQQENFLNARAEEIKIIGVALFTYIVTEFEDCIYLVDQHAMHERQNYDAYKAQIEKNNVAKQDLLVPYEFDLQQKDRQIFEEKLENLAQIGFEIKQNGNKFEIRSVPFVISNINLKEFVNEILAEKYDTSASGLVNEKLCQKACKHSIRAGDKISKDEILYLIDRIKQGVPLCPHGRPIVVKLPRKEIEKMFKRVL